jgi:3-oxoadipate enol-lactonase
MRHPFHIVALAIACAGCAAATRASTGHADVNGAQLYYEDAGQGPVVVLLQGGQLPLEMWDDQFDELSKYLRVVRYDVRGFGRSSPMKGPFSHRDDLHGLLRSLGIGRATLVGLSLGGGIAIDFALEHPDMVERLVLVGPGLSGFKFSEERGPWMDSLRVAWQARDSTRVALLWLESDYMRPAMRDSALAARLRALSTRNASLWVQPDSERVMQPPAIGRLAEIRAPTLVVLGALDTRDIRAITDTLLRKIPGAERVVIEDAGHMVNMEKPAQFNRVVLPFLRESTSQRAGESTGIDSLNARIMRAYRDRDPRMYGRLFTDSAVFEWPAFNTVRGRAGLEAMARTNWAALGDQELRLTVTSRRMAPNHAMEVGAFEQSFRDAKGARMTEYGRYVHLLARQSDNSWLIDRFFGFSDSTRPSPPRP